MASLAAVANRRACRAARSKLKIRPAPTAHVPENPQFQQQPPKKAKRGLSAREQNLLEKKTSKLFEDGKVDREYEGLPFLELTHLRLTAEDLKRDPIGHFRKEKAKDAWAQAEFHKVWSWWVLLDPDDRADIIRFSRFAGMRE